MILPNELINKIIMMNKPIYPYFNELSCRLNLSVKTKCVENIKDWETLDNGSIRYYNYYYVFGYADLLEYRDDTLQQFGELHKLWE